MIGSSVQCQGTEEILATYVMEAAGDSFTAGSQWRSHHHEPMVAARREHCLIVCTQDIPRSTKTQSSICRPIGPLAHTTLGKSPRAKTVVLRDIIVLHAVGYLGMVHAFSTIMFDSVDKSLAGSD